LPYYRPQGIEKLIEGVGFTIVDSGQIRVCFKMQGDAISSGFAGISRRFSADLVGSSARKTLQWRVFSENGPAGPGAKSREINAEMQAKTPKLRFRHFRNTL
jgi:hypothetical protein